jgi:hypothetical protein
MQPYCACIPGRLQVALCGGMGRGFAAPRGTWICFWRLCRQKHIHVPGSGAKLRTLQLPWLAFGATASRPLRRRVARRSRAREKMDWFLAAMPPKTNPFFRFQSEALDFAQALACIPGRLQVAFCGGQMAQPRHTLPRSSGTRGNQDGSGGFAARTVLISLLTKRQCADLGHGFVGAEASVQAAHIRRAAIGVVPPDGCARMR